MDKRSKKIYYQSMKTYWLSRSNHSLYYYCLEQLTHLIHTIFKGENTSNPNEELLQEIETKLSTSNFKLFQKLVHSLTLLNCNYRVYTEQGYLVTKEDMINTLSLFQLKINAESVLSQRSKWIYNEISYLYANKEFTVKQACSALQIKKPAMKNHIVALRNLGYIEHTRTGIYNTFYYKTAK